MDNRNHFKVIDIAIILASFTINSRCFNSRILLVNSALKFRHVNGSVPQYPTISNKEQQAPNAEQP